MARSRRYEQGIPLPLRVCDISDVLIHHPVHVDRTLLDEIIFEIDNLVLERNK